MANLIYPKAKQNYNFPSILTDNIKVSLVKTGGGFYVVNSATDEFYAIVPGGAIVAVSGNLASKTFVGGLFDAADISYPAVGATSATQALLIWQDSGVAATSRLLCLLDTGFTGLPVTPDGSNINVTWAAGGIFQL